MTSVNSEETTRFILKEKLIAILRGIKEEQLFNVVDTLLEAGVKVAEVTLNSDNAINLLERLNRSYGNDMCLGAGTVTSVDAARKAIKAGARFIVMPVVLPDVIQTCKELEVAVIPGAFSPTEIFQAYKMGANIIKVFPADTLGASFFRDMRGPFSEIPLAAVGGVTIENSQTFLKAGAKVLGVGSSLTPREAIQEGNWQKLIELAKGFLKIIADMK